LEFMASSLPVVLTDEPSVSRVIIPGVTGLTYPHGNVEALADRLRLLLSDTRMRHRLGHAARREVEVHHRIENTVRSVVDTLRGALTE
jgi:glycosyltransferase involved in cell wall biosynthesis